MKDQLLSRNDFRNGVFLRDGNKCVICGDLQGPLDAHHIYERRLWTEPKELGGYFLSNGVTVCPKCHLDAERTLISPEELRAAAKIGSYRLPECLENDPEFSYDKWGNVILANKTRLKGPLFHDPSVQRVLTDGNVMWHFSDLVKYPRTYHVPWSNPSADDHTLHNMNSFIGRDVVVTEKMDGENTNLYSDHFHARSLEFAKGDDRGHAKQIWSSIQHEIPTGWRICGENIYAKHSIAYSELESYFMVFSIWNERNEALSWGDTEALCAMLGLVTVPVLYRGPYDEEKIKSLFIPNREPDLMEGYVVRTADSFPYSSFRKSIAKFVRKNHVTTSNHWRHDAIVPNGLKEHKDV